MLCCMSYPSFAGVARCLLITSAEWSHLLVLSQGALPLPYVPAGTRIHYGWMESFESLFNRHHQYHQELVEGVVICTTTLRPYFLWSCFCRRDKSMPPYRGFAGHGDGSLAFLVTVDT